MPKVLVEQLEMVDVATLEVHPENARRGDSHRIAESFANLDVFAPIGVQRSTRRVLWGNHRLLAARLSGMTEYPVVWLDVTDEAHARAILVADNRTSDLSDWDDGPLLAILDKIETDGNLLAVGYTDSELAMLRALNDEPDPTDPDSFTPGPSESKVQIGPFRFAVSREAMDAFEADLISVTNGSLEQLTAELRRRLCL